MATPSLKNNFGVKFHAYDQTGRQIWTNPHVNQLPSLPSTDTALVETCKKVAENKIEDCVLVLDPIIVNVLALKDLKTLIELHLVCKSLYSAVKSDSVWAAQFRSCFSKVQHHLESPFSTEEQFKIYYKAMIDAKKPYKAQFEKNNEILSQLDNDLALADWEYSHFSNRLIDTTVGLLANLSDVDQMLEVIDASNEFSEEANGIKRGLKLSKLMREKYRLGGNDHKGEMSISPQNQQLLCQNAIKTWVREAFNDQKNFNEKMQAAVDAKNNPLI